MSVAQEVSSAAPNENTAFNVLHMYTILCNNQLRWHRYQKDWLRVNVHVLDGTCLDLPCIDMGILLIKKDNRGDPFFVSWQHGEGVEHTGLAVFCGQLNVLRRVTFVLGVEVVSSVVSTCTVARQQL